ncbi:wd40 repeat [Fusarium longipes]|uniref:Wd40 repeat n=1 Tax=Fusarium longipes TaxID=694270 RepID=A0A395SWY3_9HYPO|nr:wd40 repeat [Fusarium longipes]
MNDSDESSRRERFKRKVKSRFWKTKTTTDSLGDETQVSTPGNSHIDLPARLRPQSVSVQDNASDSNEPPNVSTPEVHDTSGSPVKGTLWARAYHEATKDEDFQELLQKYQRFLKEHHDITDKECDDMFKVLSVSKYKGQETPFQKRAKESLETLASSRLSFTVGDKTVVVREEVEKIVQFLSNFKGVISAATSADPHAALAWSGVTAALPLLENAIQQDQKAVDGFERISFLLIRYALLEEKFFPSRSKEDYPLLLAVENKIVTLYVTIYKYQLRIILHCAHKKVRRMLGNMSLVVKWEAMISEIDKNNREVDEAVNVMHRTDNSIMEKLNNIDVTIKECTARIGTLQQATLDLAVLDKIPYVASAVFDSPDVRKHGECLEGTQRDALGKIQSWIHDPDGVSVFWLVGMAGTGKSSIARTVANCLNTKMEFMSRMPQIEDNIFLGATFFFSQEDPERNTVKYVIPTFSTTLAQRVPALGRYISEFILKDTTVGHKDLLEQMAYLISKPLSALNQTIPVHIRLVLILDALDECEEMGGARRLLSLLSTLGKFDNVDVRVLVVSRHQSDISRTFDNPDIFKMSPRRYTLEKIPRRANEQLPDDIAKYIKHELDKVTSTKRFGQGWLKMDEMNQLIDRADGLFIYAATTCRFLDITDDPDIQQSRLQQLITGRPLPGTPEQRLDDIYRRVLAFPTRELSDEEKAVLNAKFRLTLGAIALLFESPVITTLEHLIMPVNGLFRTLEKFHSVLDVPEDDSSPLKFFHASFRDFLLDRTRSGHDYCIDELEIHRLVLRNCLQIMNRDLHQDLCDLKLPGTSASDVPKESISMHISPHLKYSCLYWMRHLEKLNQHEPNLPCLDDGNIVSNFFDSKFLFWLEALSLLGEYGRSILVIKELHGLVPAGRSPKLSEFLQDAYRFVMKNSKSISQAPLQTYVSALIFSPLESIVRMKFLNLVPSWIMHFPDIKQNWDQEIMAFSGPPNEATDFVTSKDGKILVAAHHNMTKVWDLTTGLEMLKFEDSSHIEAVAISGDQRTVASGLSNKSIVLRDLDGGPMTVLTGHDGFLDSIALSNTGNLLASSHWGGHIRLWDRTNKAVLYDKTLCDSAIHTWVGLQLLPLVFSPDGKFLIVGCGETITGAILIWNIEENTEEKIMHHQGIVKAIQISPNGESLASLDDKGSLRVWSLNTKSILSQIDFDQCGYSMAWCPQQPSTLALALSYSPITLCNIASTTAQVIETIDSNDSKKTAIRGLAYSQTLGYLVSLSGGYLRLWDTDMNAEPVKEMHKILSIDFLEEGKPSSMIVMPKMESINFLEDGKHSLLFIMNASARMLSLETGTTRIIQDGVYKVDMSADHSLVAFCMSDYSVQFWDSTLTKRLQVVKNTSDVFFPKSNKVVVLMWFDKAYLLDPETLETKVTIPLRGEWVPGQPTFTDRLMTLVTTPDEGKSFLLWLYCLNTGDILHGSPHPLDSEEICRACNDAWLEPGGPFSTHRKMIRGFLSPDELSTIDYKMSREEIRRYGQGEYASNHALECRDNWIWQGDERLILLPPEFGYSWDREARRGYAMFNPCSPKVAACSDRIFVVSKRETIAYFKFDLRCIPTRK